MVCVTSGSCSAQSVVLAMDDNLKNLSKTCAKCVLAHAEVMVAELEAACAKIDGHCYPITDVQSELIRWRQVRDAANEIAD